MTQPFGVTLGPEILHYGYLFIVLGTVVEGDATLLTAAFLAHRGYFRLPWVIAACALTTMAASHVYYLLARRAGVGWLAGHGSARVDAVTSWAGRNAGGSFSSAAS